MRHGTWADESLCAVLSVFPVKTPKRATRVPAQYAWGRGAYSGASERLKRLLAKHWRLRAFLVRSGRPQRQGSHPQLRPHPHLIGLLVDMLIQSVLIDVHIPAMLTIAHVCIYALMGALCG